MAIKVTNCTLKIIPNYRCVICRKFIHRGDSSCVCSTFRSNEFNSASICITCADVYDRLMSNNEFRPILICLLNKKYYEGVGVQSGDD